MKTYDAKTLENIMIENVLNQVQLAKKLNTSKQFISQILNGKRKLSHNMLSKLKEAFPEYFANCSNNIDGNNLKDLRVSCNYTREQFAEILGISSSLVYKLETGERVITPEINERIKLFSCNKSSSNINLKPIRRLDSLEIKYCPDVCLPKQNNLISSSKEVVVIDKKLLLNDSLNINYHKCKIVAISNNSLSPMFSAGDKCVIDESCKHFVDEQIFAFVVNNQCYLRKINILPSRIKCTSISDNRDTFYLDTEKDCTVVGMVLKIRF